MSLDRAGSSSAAFVAEKNKRYDRGIRIWGTHGQQRLERSKVVVCNASATGAETLKNLVLGGIASFTIVDGAKVQASDLGNNWLVDAGSIGESRAKVVTKLLQEMNDSVAGSYVEESPAELIASNPTFFSDFTLVIATQLREADAIKLDEICRQLRVPLLLVRSYGLVGSLRVSLPEHLVIESKPDNVLDDLRLNRPFPELLSFALSFDLDTLDDITHHHLPYAVLLLHAAEAWKAGHGGALPSASKERSEFKELLGNMRRQQDGLLLEQINFDEALKAAFHVWTTPSVPSEVRAILNDPSACNLTRHSDDFWVVVSAIRAFMEKEGAGQLPLEGSIPDMHALTELYLKLQRIYRDKAEADVSAVESYVQAALQSVGRDPASIPRDVIRLMCKNARNLRIVRYRTLAAEAGSPGSDGSAAAGSGGRRSALQQALLAAESSHHDAHFYVLLRAADRFHAAHGRFPGSYDDNAEEDIPVLKTFANQILAEAGASGINLSDDCAVEICRFGAGELHVVAAVMGGMASQEAIKIIIRQFTPVGGTLLYNAIASTTTVLEL